MVSGLLFKSYSILSCFCVWYNIYCCSVAKLCLTLCYLMDCSISGFPVHHQILVLAQAHVHQLVMTSNHLILCCPLLLLPAAFLSIRVFSNESVLCIRWPKYQSFSISPSREYSRLISFRIDWFDLLSVQRTLKSLLQHHNLKPSILWCSTFFMVQLTSIHDYWKNHSFDYMDLCWQNYLSAF